MMKCSNLYRKILAAGFLLLYIFIYAPVQLWHHHNASGVTTSKTIITKAVAGSSAEDCKICNHTYTDYADDHCSLQLIDGKRLPAFYAPFSVELPHPDMDDASNKGPPQHCSSHS